MNRVKAMQYMEIAYATSRFSKDESTQVGAVIVGPTNEVRSLGYNGAPRGCSADDRGDTRGSTRPEKYFWYSHAELNAITNAARVGVPLEGSTIVVTHPPCMDCARAIVQAGIKQVVAARPAAEFAERWIEHTRRVQTLFSECKVGYYEIDPKE